MSHLHAVPIPDPVGDDLAAQDASLDIACPRCGVDTDAYCRNTETGHTLRASHWQRLKAARTETT